MSRYYIVSHKRLLLFANKNNVFKLDFVNSSLKETALHLPKEVL